MNLAGGEYGGAINRLPKEDSTLNGDAPRRVLVVDDNIDGANSLAMLLQLLGCDTRTAHDGQAAVDLAASYQPNIILLDIGLPKISGLEACRLIRNQPHGRDMIIVALTGWGQSTDRKNTQDAGFDMHLVKPIDPNVLEQVLAMPVHAHG